MGFCERTSAASAQAKLTVGAKLSRASKLRRCRGRKAPEEAAGQAAAIVDHDAPAGNAGLVQNHGALYSTRFWKRDIR
jgi:hypothetical protein